jgi:hypothetical protein
VASSTAETSTGRDGSASGAVGEQAGAQEYHTRRKLEEVEDELYQNQIGDKKLGVIGMQIIAIQ